jgi:hypothetical protein
LPVSAIVCSVSANRAGEPVSTAAVAFATPMVVFAASAASTLVALSSPSAVRGGWTADTAPSLPDARGAALGRPRPPRLPGACAVLIGDA